MGMRQKKGGGFLLFLQNQVSFFPHLYVMIMKFSLFFFIRMKISLFNIKKIYNDS